MAVLTKRLSSCKLAQELKISLEVEAVKEVRRGKGLTRKKRKGEIVVRGYGGKRQTKPQTTFW